MIITQKQIITSAITLVLAFTAEITYSQSTKTVTKSGTDHQDTIIQKGDKQSTTLSQHGIGQHSFVIQQGYGQDANLNQSGVKNFAFIYQLLNNKHDNTQVAILKQSGLNNYLYLLQADLSNVQVTQDGTGNYFFL